ncbi:Fur-regulated basic protein FbpA [Peribacillus asahii]|uniref:Fur-regulated basic protein FbpA n=1 Tax=Peribacillus asahii TaxID=228899 RepID=UPI00207A2DC3|nr:Fur-regulated basic protein FbpA [Peribacillus asahii]USK71419.1 Fur-regulated basic protein FbpA [Peribacillus asahii]
MELFKKIEERKALLIDKLLAKGVYKTKDERHLYDVPLKVLEDEYKLVVDKPDQHSPSSWMT